MGKCHKPKIIEGDAAFKIKNEKSERMRSAKRGNCRGAPVMIRLITETTAGVAHVCCLYSGTRRDRGGLTGRELAASLNKTRH